VGKLTGERIMTVEINAVNHKAVTDLLDFEIGANTV